MPTSPRLHIETPLSEGALLSLGEEASNYLVRVLRVSLGEQIRLFNTGSGEWQGRIEAVGARKTVVLLEKLLRKPPPPDPAALWLLFAPVKRDNTDLIVEKATELGASVVLPVLTERTQTRTVRIDRFRKIAIEAAEQTERLDVPEIADVRTLPHALDALPAGMVLIFCDESGDDPAASWGGAAGRAPSALTAFSALKGRPAAILVGPEGGFTPFERSALRARPATYPVSLGPRILRAETAAVAAMALWQAACGDWA